MRGATARQMVVVVAFVTMAACGGGGGGGSAKFERRPYEPVMEAIRTGGMVVCGDEVRGATLAGDYEHRSISVAAGGPGSCPSVASNASGLIVLRSFNARSTRDQAAKSGFGDGLIYWTWGDKTISVTMSSRPEVVAATEEAMKSLGATLVLDKR